MLTFTVESDAVQDTAWRTSVDELIDLAAQCDQIAVGATTGAKREATRSPYAESNTIRGELFDTVEHVPENARWGMSEWGSGAVYGGPEEVDLADRLAHLFTNRPDRPFATLRLERREDIQHLCTHARSERDVFVTTDEVVLGKQAELLRDFGIRVERPDGALRAAREHCSQ